MASLCITLEARSPAHRCFRAYEIAAGVDLFGAWLVDMSYGRIGTSGRTKTRSFPMAEEARAQVMACLQKRARAPRRIGVAYRVRTAVRSTEWGEPALDERLRTWFPGCDDGQTRIAT
jgi:predicted DNA-binding WGR domain protein